MYQLFRSSFLFREIKTEHGKDIPKADPTVNCLRYGNYETEKIAKNFNMFFVTMEAVSSCNHPVRRNEWASTNLCLLEKQSDLPGPCSLYALAASNDTAK